MNRQDAIEANYRDIFYHKTGRNADGSAVRVRVSGKCKTWKTRPTEFRLPVKYGLYGHHAITHENCGDWLTFDPTEAHEADLIRAERTDNCGFRRGVYQTCAKACCEYLFGRDEP